MTTTRRVLLILATLAPVFAPGQTFAPEYYYGNVDTSDAATLRATLHATISGHNRIAYSNGNNWTILEAADINPSNPSDIMDFYGNISYPIVASSRPYNREHMWPQSYGFTEDLDTIAQQGYYPRTDMHALRLVDSGLNSTRSNRIYDYVPATPRGAAETVLNNGVGGGAVVYPGNHNWYSNTVSTWEVWNFRRGDAARSLFYMDVRYEGGTHPVTATPEPDLILTENTTLIQPTSTSPAYMGRLSTLLQWHAQDPVTAEELTRMQVIANSQRNRNPFVDHPEYVAGLFSGDMSGIAPINPQGVIALARPEAVVVQWDPRIESDLAGYNVYYSTSPSGPFTKANASLLTTTSYEVTGLTNGVEYYFAARATDTDANESGNSAVARATPGARSTLRIESFEKPASPSTWTITGGIGNPASGDYFDRYNWITFPNGFGVVTTGRDGNYFIGGEDTNGSGLTTDGIHTVTLAPVSIGDHTNLSVSIQVGALAADVYDTSDRAAGDYLRVMASVDGGADVMVGQFTRVGTPSAANGRFGVDSNLDGFGDVELPSYTDLNPYTFNIASTGSSLVVKVVTRFEAGGEQFAYDDVRVSSIAPVASTAVTGWMLYQ